MRRPQSHPCIKYGCSLRPCLGTSIAPRRRAPSPSRPTREQRLPYGRLDYPEREVERKPVTAVTEQNFDEEVLQNDQAVLVDFWAEWCGAGPATAPVPEQIQSQR